MYDIFAYGKMIADAERMQAYSKALRHSINSDSIVLDIGTGTGILALLACRFGARRVYAVEPGPAIQVAREIADANGWSKKIVFYQNVSTDIFLPEPVHVIVSDLRGVLPVFQNHIPSIIDARNRLLARNGILIPLQDSLYIAAATAPHLIEDYRQPWNNAPYEIDMHPAARYLSHVWRKGSVTEQQLLTDSACWTTVDYRIVDRGNAQGKATLKAYKNGIAHGLVVWFDAVLAEGIGFSTAPGHSESVYGNAFFPFPEPVALCKDDTLTVSLKASLIANDYVWGWDSTIFSGSDTHQIKAEFRQSTFYAKPLLLQNLRKREISFMPRVGIEGQIDRFILHRMDGKQTLRKIAIQVLNQFPDHFRDEKQALRRAADLSVRYSQKDQNTST